MKDNRVSSSAPFCLGEFVKLMAGRNVVGGKSYLSCSIRPQSVYKCKLTEGYYIECLLILTLKFNVLELCLI